MKVAVLGARGFVGGHILRVLRERGDDVRAVVRSPDFAPEGVERRLADACDVYQLREALTGCDHAVHAVLGSAEVIVGSMAPVYAAAQAVGVKRLVYISTGVVHGQAPAPGTDENSPTTIFQPFPYNTAKVRAERRLMRLRERGTVEIVLLRPTIVFGPGSRWGFDFANALHENRAFVVDSGRAICNSIYVDNLAHAVRLALNAPGVDRQAFLIGDEETVTWADLYRPICDLYGVRFEDVPSFPPPDVTPSIREQYLEPIRSSESVQVALRRMPPAIKAAIRAAVRSLRRVRPRPPADQVPDDTTLPAEPEITPEIATLQSCRWRLPHDKARRLLGYDPPVSFDEGCHRTVKSLAQRAEAHRFAPNAGVTARRFSPE